MASTTPCAGFDPTTCAGWALDAVISQVKRADAAIQHATRLVDEGHHQEAVRATAEAQQLFEFAKNSAINLALSFEAQQQIQPGLKAELEAYLDDTLPQHWVSHSGLQSNEPQQLGGGDLLIGAGCAVGFDHMLAAGLAAAVAAADDTEGEPEVTSRMRPHSEAPGSHSSYSLAVDSGRYCHSLPVSYYWRNTSSAGAVIVGAAAFLCELMYCTSLNSSIAAVLRLVV